MGRPTNKHSQSIVWTARGLAGLFVLAAISQAKLHTIEKDGTIRKAEATNRYTLSRTEFARRGSIFDTNGKPLATDESTYTLTVEFRKIPQSDAFFLDLSRASGVPASEFAELAATKLSSREWKVPLGAAQREAVQKVKETWRADGVSLGNPGRRSYPLGADASGVVGLVRDGKPYMGLELSKDKILAAQNGKKVGFVDRQGQFLPTRVQDSVTEKRNGDSITLTIDADLQALASAAVRDAVKRHNADDGVALVMDPHNGDLLAMASAPSFQPYQSDGSNGDLSGNSGYNPAYMGVLEPGSTFKILTLAKALDDHKATMGDTIQCGGVLQLNKSWRVRCDIHHGNRAHGAIDPTVAIAKSCNVAAASWALRVGREPFVKYIEDLGLLKRTDLGLPQETQGLFNYDEYAKPLQLANLGFGQSISTSPVALIGAFGMLANEGVRIEPRLVKRIGETDLAPAPGQAIIQPKTAHEVLKAMEAVIQTDAGTGKSLRIPGYRLGGKTGTAQKIGGGTDGYVANFVGFVPADKPRAVVLVMINHPKAAGYYGAVVAGPPFLRIAKGIIRHFNIPPSEPSSTIGE